MSVNLTYAVFGLGKYGIAVTNELLRNGAEVLAVDSNENIVNSLSNSIPVCKCADITNAEVIESLGIAEIDVVIIAISEDLDASILATVLCKEAGVKRVVAKCSSEMHGKILEKVGADAVVFPETESGTRLARNLLNSGFSDLIELSDNISMVELTVNPKWIGKSLIELDLRKRYGINVVAVKTDGNVSIEIDPAKLLDENMQLIVIADIDKLKRIK